jgi:DNA-binding CsgD family transcriptional regulator
MTVHPDLIARLNRREKQILQLYPERGTYKQIAHALGLREATIRNNVTVLLSKLDLPHLGQAAVLFDRWARRQEGERRSGIERARGGAARPGPPQRGHRGPSGGSRRSRQGLGQEGGVTLGIYTALGWRWVHIPRSPVLHLVPLRPGPLSRSACGRFEAGDAAVWSSLGLADEERCGRCQDKDGTAGPAGDGRTAQVGE